MTLVEAITAAGMTPPPRVTPGRWLRFPGVGKGKENRAGWCRMITPTLAIYGDWSSDFKATWIDSAHRDDAQTARLLAQARAREAAFAAEQRARQAAAATRAEQIVRGALMRSHPYLERKGFAHLKALVHQGDPVVPAGKTIRGMQLVVPMRDALAYERLISAQLIDERGEKVFLPGGRATGAVFCIGATPGRARRILLCEGYATALSLDAALTRLPGPHAVIACFSADNLVRVASHFPRAQVAADNDEPNQRTGAKAGEEAARRTGLPWGMPPDVGTDYNDMHRSHGLHAVTEALRTL
jgi:putative DNA primase/helicase